MKNKGSIRYYGRLSLFLVLETRGVSEKGSDYQWAKTCLVILISDTKGIDPRSFIRSEVGSVIGVCLEGCPLYHVVSSEHLSYHPHICLF